MGKEAIAYADDGTRVDPSSRSDWEQWVSASKTRNHVREDPLLDWLDRHGESKGFARDAVDKRTDFGRFVMNKGIEFEEAVVKHLGTLGVGQVLVVGAESASERPSQDLGLAYETWDAMCGGVEIICQGVLRDPEHKTYGMPDLLVRSDVLATLLPSFNLTGTGSGRGAGSADRRTPLRGGRHQVHDPAAVGGRRTKQLWLPVPRTRCNCISTTERSRGSRDTCPPRRSCWAAAGLRPRRVSSNQGRFVHGPGSPPLPTTRLSGAIAAGRSRRPGRAVAAPNAQEREHLECGA